MSASSVTITVCEIMLTSLLDSDILVFNRNEVGRLLILIIWLNWIDSFLSTSNRDS